VQDLSRHLNIPLSDILRRLDQQGPEGEGGKQGQQGSGQPLDDLGDGRLSDMLRQLSRSFLREPGQSVLTRIAEAVSKQLGPGGGDDGPQLVGMSVQVGDGDPVVLKVRPPQPSGGSIDPAVMFSRRETDWALHTEGCVGLAIIPRDTPAALQDGSVSTSGHQNHHQQQQQQQQQGGRHLSPEAAALLVRLVTGGSERFSLLDVSPEVMAQLQPPATSEPPAAAGDREGGEDGRLTLDVIASVFDAEAEQAGAESQPSEGEIGGGSVPGSAMRWVTPTRFPGSEDLTPGAPSRWKPAVVHMRELQVLGPGTAAAQEQGSAEGWPASQSTPAGGARTPGRPARRKEEPGADADQQPSPGHIIANLPLFNLGPEFTLFPGVNQQ
jgi:hypothetical protein